MVYSAGFCQPRSYFVAAHPVQIFGLGDDSVLTVIGSGDFPLHQTHISGLQIIGGAGHRDENPLRYRGGGIFYSDGYVKLDHNVIEHNSIMPAEPEAVCAMAASGVKSMAAAAVMEKDFRYLRK